MILSGYFQFIKRVPNVSKWQIQLDTLFIWGIYRIKKHVLAVKINTMGLKNTAKVLWKHRSFYTVIVITI